MGWILLFNAFLSSFKFLINIEATMIFTKRWVTKQKKWHEHKQLYSLFAQIYFSSVNLHGTTKISREILQVKIQNVTKWKEKKVFALFLSLPLLWRKKWRRKICLPQWTVFSTRATICHWSVKILNLLNTNYREH